MRKACLVLSGLVAVGLIPAQSLAQVRDPDDAIPGAVVGGAVGGVLGGVLGGWQERQRHHEERMERERWRQAHGGQLFPGDFGPGGSPGPRPVPGPPHPGYRGGAPGGPGTVPPQGRPAQYGRYDDPGFRGRPEGYPGPRRPSDRPGPPARPGGEPDEAWR